MKQRRLQEIVDCFHTIAAVRKRKRFIGTKQLVLVETVKCKSDGDMGMGKGRPAMVFGMLQSACLDWFKSQPKLWHLFHATISHTHMQHICIHSSIIPYSNRKAGAPRMSW